MPRGGNVCRPLPPARVLRVGDGWHDACTVGRGDVRPPMRILELHSPYFRALWRREHDVLCWGPHPECDVRQTAPAPALAEVLATLPAGWTPDLIVFGDDCRLLGVTGLEDAPCPTAMISVDAHHNAGWHAPMAAAFDHVFVAQKDYLPAFFASGAPRVHWFPCWAPDGCPPPAAAKRYEVAFVGTLDARLNPERVALIEALRSRLPLHAVEGDYRDVFPVARVVLNQTVRGDLNARVFEAMACGAFLMTERTGNGLLDLFADGEQLVTYPRGDVEAIVRLAARWVAADRARAAIAERGRAAVQAAHLEHHRAAELLARVAADRTGTADEIRHAGAARAYCQLAYYARRLGQHFLDDVYPVLRQRYLAAAGRLAAAPGLAETDRRAVLGLVALERGRTPEALDHLGWVAEHGGRVEDHVVRIEALVRLGDLVAARRAAELLRASYPAYEAGDAMVAGLGLLGPTG